MDLKPWEEEINEMFAKFDNGDFSALEGLFVEVPDYVIEWWVNVPEPLNGISKDIAYRIYGYETPSEVAEWIDNQASVLTALYHVERVIKERKEREALRKMLGW